MTGPKDVVRDGYDAVSHRYHGDHDESPEYLACPTAPPCSTWAADAAYRWPAR